MRWEEKILEMTSGIPVVAIVFTVAVLLNTSAWIYHRQKRSGSTTSWIQEILSSNKPSDGKKSNETRGNLKNIWDERRRNGSAEADAAKLRKTDDDGRPFGSSYYYAHNGISKTGGYTDGLRMEDYQMETPRLLSKGGVRVDDDAAPATTIGNPTQATQKKPLDPTKPSQKRVVAKTTTPITKYLWDDSGDSKCMGTIRIDTLPGDIPWKDAQINDVCIDLVGDSELKVLVEASVGNNSHKTYQLHLPKLYGPVTSVKKVAKETRLLVRLYKTKTGKNAKVEAWPHPYKKV